MYVFIEASLSIITWQRFLAANEFIKPLRDSQIINDYKIEQWFSNWFNLIAYNTVLLWTLQEEVQYKEHIIT